MARMERQLSPRVTCDLSVPRNRSSDSNVAGGASGDSAAGATTIPDVTDMDGMMTITITLSRQTAVCGIRTSQEKTLSQKKINTLLDALLFAL